MNYGSLKEEWMKYSRFAFFRVDSRLIVSDLRLSAEICGKEL